MNADETNPGEDRTQVNIKKETEEEENTPPGKEISPPYVVIVDGPHMGARFELLKGENKIGRSSECQVRLDDQSISRHHASITYSDGNWETTDNNSKNGTFVNGEKIEHLVNIGHKDCVKVGIYLVRLILEESSREEEMTIPSNLTTSDRTVFMSAPPDAGTQEVKSKSKATPKKEKKSKKEADIIHEQTGEEIPAEPVAKKKFKIRLPFIVLLGVGFVIALFFGWRFLSKEKKTDEMEKTKIVKEEVKTIPAKPLAKPTTPKAPKTTDKVPPAKPKPVEPQKPTTVPVFLDFASSPLSAVVTFQNKVLGQTPIRINLELEPNRTYTANALFNLPEIREDYRQETSFTVEADKSVVPIFFRAPIGILKINELPPDISFYLEGTFDYRTNQQNPAKLEEIVLQKPIYLPLGKYVVELRRTRRLGKTSPTTVDDIIFKREFRLAEENPTYTIEVKEDDLKVFPAHIKSVPINANVFIDGKPVGKTPYKGLLPLGEHVLTVRKEGYFEHTETLKVDINTTFVATIELKTSIAGARINNARAAMKQGLYQAAINELAEALNNKPTSNEKSLANYMLGKCYLELNNTDRAISYFEQAKQDLELKNKATLGLVNAYAIKGNTAKALQMLVEVFLGAKDESEKRSANALFQKISPFRSVIYIYTDPAGATVKVNDKTVNQKTPMILHQLHLGSYKIHIEKKGYLPTDLNLSLSINEFNPISVKLKPLPE